MIPLRRAACVLGAWALALGSLGLTPAHAASLTDPPGAATTVDTSSIQLSDISPGVIPTQGNIVLQGTLHNGSGTTWHDLRVVPSTSTLPRTTAANLATAATTDPAEVQLGSTLWGLAAPLPDLASGASTSFTITIPRDRMEIVGAPGVYWLGVTPISDETHPATLTTRTFLPLFPTTVNPTAHLNIALVVPLRGNPLRTTNGALADPGAFNASLSDNGRLGRILSFAHAAGDRPLTWLVDPALLDLIGDTVAATTAYPIGDFDHPAPTPAPLPADPASASASGTAAGVPSNSASSSPTGTATTPAQPPTADQLARLQVRSWLDAATAVLKRSNVYALPYADPSIAALLGTGHNDLLATATGLSEQSMAARGLTAAPAVAPTSGMLSQSEWSALATGETAFVSRAATTNTSTVTAEGRTLVVAADASTGGPGPTSQTSSLNLRQRLLGEAALAASSPTATNLTVVLPSSWDPGSAATIAGFFGPLTQPWISFTGLPPVTAGSAQLTQATPELTASQRADADAVGALQASIKQLFAVIAPNPAITSRLNRQLEATALGAASAAAEASLGSYRSNAVATASSLTGLLDDVRIAGSQFVTLSGSSGVITVTLQNDLNVPVRVGLRQTGVKPRNPVTVANVAPIALEPGERSTVRIHLTAPRVSVQEVTITPVDSSGVAIGSSLTFTVRSSPVGTVVWAIIIAVGLMIVVLLGRSIQRRRRNRRAAATPADGPPTPDAPESP